LFIDICSIDKRALVSITYDKWLGRKVHPSRGSRQARGRDSAIWQRCPFPDESP